jgi:hypothetical protein
MCMCARVQLDHVFQVEQLEKGVALGNTGIKQVCRWQDN